MKKFVSVLLATDNAFGATEATCYRFEEVTTVAYDGARTVLDWFN